MDLFLKMTFSSPAKPQTTICLSENLQTSFLQQSGYGLITLWSPSCSTGTVATIKQSFMCELFILPSPVVPVGSVLSLRTPAHEVSGFLILPLILAFLWFIVALNKKLRTSVKLPPYL